MKIVSHSCCFTKTIEGLPWQTKCPCLVQGALEELRPSVAEGRELAPKRPWRVAILSFALFLSTFCPCHFAVQTIESRSMLPYKSQDTDLHLRRRPLISVIVPVHNRLSDLEDCLQALAWWRTEGCELILVDDQSTGNVREIAERHGARYFRTPHREGPAGPRNLGARKAFGDPVLRTLLSCAR